jgi:putative pyruvate formate lyase activating enzyme
MRTVGRRPEEESVREASYVALHRSGELAERAERGLRLLGGTCRVCPRACRVDRLRDERSICHVGRRAIVAAHFPHLGEEDPLRGWSGSGTIFFAGCNLRCVFCQNFDISWEVRGEEVAAERLAEMMLELQTRGCHNVNLVTPEHVVPQILEALAIAAEAGLRLPIVYNTSSYDSMDSLELLDGVVDVFMPDLKLWTAERARRYLRRPDYPQVARRTVKEMHRQVGPLVLDANGIAVRGVLLRHLVMPGMLDETEQVLRWVAEELGPDTYLNLMAQYRPDGLVPRGGYPEMDRRPRRDEYLRALEIADALALHRLDAGSLASARTLPGRPAVHR